MFKAIVLKTKYKYIANRAWGGVVVKALRYYSEVPGSIPVISMASDNSMCPGSTESLKNEYQDTPGSKDGRCVRLTTYHLQAPMSRNLEPLTSLKPLDPVGL
jgi:hypothetical protein